MDAADISVSSFCKCLEAGGEAMTPDFNRLSRITMSETKETMVVASIEPIARGEVRRLRLTRRRILFWERSPSWFWREDELIVTIYYDSGSWWQWIQ